MGASAFCFFRGRIGWVSLAFAKGAFQGNVRGLD
jgi:hypothetical protein